MNANIFQQIESMLPALSREERVRLAGQLERQLQQEVADATPANAGQPLVEIVKSDDRTASPEAAFWDNLAAAGVLDSHPWAAASSAPADFQPILVAGPPLSETIIENRR